ncbi:DUF4007 family protein [Chryseobacterium arthrosphaerae]|uniref:DUF4007 family protein n=1 Tax=Chryseobacterium arthrosphaerae TaxID=651561 RepID=UPI001F4B7516|nr:DUF4007 family protein [Chryseobacterium arthrosphaerae]
MEVIYNKLQFSGHESFSCKHFWLKKGVNLLENQHSFTDENAVIELGVGKNMVTSIRYWCKSLNVIGENDKISDFGSAVFSDQGLDPYLEDIGTIWLLHYYLIKTNKASIYSLVFNEFRKERTNFTKDQLHSFLKRVCIEAEELSKYNTSTINTDINVFLRNYLSSEKNRIEIEDSFSNIFIELGLIQEYNKIGLDNKLENWLKIENGKRESLPYHIVLFTILDNYSNTTISFQQLSTGYNSPGNIFALTSEELYKIIIKITDNYPEVIYSETAGNRILQIKNTISKWEVLNEYYR